MGHNHRGWPRNAFQLFWSLLCVVRLCWPQQPAAAYRSRHIWRPARIPCNLLLASALVLCLGEPVEPFQAGVPPGTVTEPLRPPLDKGGPARARYVGGAGNVAAINENGVAVTFAAVPAGAVLPIATKRVNATGTTATNLIAL